MHSHSSRAGAASRKTHNDRNQQILKALLKEQANKNCADCKTATHPRWASWNLGCFICIRCSGIHRSMGTHISRVKSVDLDSWTDEQVKSVVSWGNAKANAFWEDGLPQGYVPDDSKIENFIRTKYEKKKWAKSKVVPDPNSISAPAGQTPASTLENKEVPALAKPYQQPQPASNNLLDFDFGSAQPASPADSLSSASISSQQQQPQQQQQQKATQSLPNLQSSLLSSLNTPKQQQAAQQQQQQPKQAINSRPDLKKSILSLYSTPTSSTPNFHQQPQQMSYQPILNTSRSFQQPQQQIQQPANPQLNVSNPWSSNNSTSNTSNKNPLDDDLFKNVWT